MRSLFAIISISLLSFTAHWQTDFSKAKQIAAAEHKYILLSFSGSDWCGPCIRLHKEIFENNSFADFANQNLVLVNADFPRAKKNQLSKQQQQENNKLAETYNTAGSFPYTVLLNENGVVVKSWTGLPKEDAIVFTNELKQAMHLVN